MKNEKETRERLIEKAKKEFLEKGYMQASLRNICKNAEVTTGALYFFFENKEDLFACLVETPLKELYKTINQYFEKERSQLNTGTMGADGYTDHFEITKKIVCCMYKHYDGFLLLITKAQGSKFEKFIDQFVEITEKYYRGLADHMALEKNVPKLDNYMIHWVTHTQVDFFIHMITHEKSEEAALRHVEVITKCLRSGWKQLFEKE